MQPDEIQIAAVQGWLELGDFAQAQEELRRFPAEQQSNPEVTRLWMMSSVVEGNWRDVHRFALELRAALPNDSEATFHVAEALHRLNRTTEAIDEFTRSAHQFEDPSIAAYTVARYHCALNQPIPALESLGRAFAVRPGLRRKALLDPDLALIALHLADDDDEFMARYEPER